MAREYLSTTLKDKVLASIKKNNLVSTGDKLLVAVSGGADSVCMLHILNQLKNELKVELHVAHLNHGLRKTEADADAKYVQNIAGKLALPVMVDKRDVAAYRKEHHLSLEEAAREVRYDFLAETAKSVGANRVAIGHTTDDHIETILLHLIRGSGTRGLRGLQFAGQWQSSGEGVTIIRPLLDITREETTRYCRRHRLAPRLDSSNLSLSPLRNRIRQQLLPLMQSYNPQVVKALLRTARIAEDELDFIDAEAKTVWDKVVSKREKAIILQKEGFTRMAPALQRHLLRLSIADLIGNLRDIDMEHIEDMLAISAKPAGREITLPGGLVFIVGYDDYQLTLAPEALSPLPPLEGEVTLNAPGKTVLPNWQIEATIVPPGVLTEDKGDFRAFFDFAETGSKLTVRERRPGDRFQPLGMEEPKKINEFMIDAKIPHIWRGRIPIVSSPNHVIWVVGWRIDERVKVTKDTAQILCLKFKQVPK